ncbi:hypothetical protein DFH09DRAFT_1439992 [Mycena vulgaris]|nr:hypothetical protein DFH09DRAFT_1439992 [Mycena vulgaris]
MPLQMVGLLNLAAAAFHFGGARPRDSKITLHASARVVSPYYIACNLITCPWTLHQTIPLDDKPLLGHARLGRSIWGVLPRRCKVLLQMPTPQSAPSPHYTSTRGNFWSPTYVVPATPYTMFLPAVYPWYGELFGQLDYRRTKLPIVKRVDLRPNGTIREGWGLERDVLQAWENLETLLQKVLLAMAEHNCLPVADPYIIFGLPYRWGYKNLYPTENAARTVIFHARTGFLPLLANLSMFFWCMHVRYLIKDAGARLERTNPPDASDWRRRVCEISGVHLAALADLENSAAGDLTIPRIGGIIDFTPGKDPTSATTSWNMQFLIPSIIATRLPVPLYISWGEIEGLPEIFIPHGLEYMKFVPDAHEVGYLHSLPGNVAFSCWTRSIDYVTRKQVLSSCRDSDPIIASPAKAAVLRSRSPDVSKFPAVEPGSGQRQGEHMADFFLRRQKVRQEKAVHETPDARARREQRERDVLKGGSPGKGGPRVFIWEEIDGHYIRQAAGRSKYASYWNDHGPEQRRYDSYYNEWDLCEDFGDDPSDDEDANYLVPLQIEEDILADYQMLPETEGGGMEDGEVYSSEADLKRIHGIPDLPPATGSDVISVARIALVFKNMVHLRFGCTLPEDRLESDLTLPSVIVANKLLGGGEIMSSEDELYNFRLFLAHCKEAKSLSGIPSVLLDFHQLNSELYDDWTVQVRRAVLNNELYYLISEKEREQWRGLCIVVQSATTALEIVRQGWGPSLRDVMDQLLSRGIGFKTCCQFEVLSLEPLGRNFRYSGLGFRPPNYKPDLTDYHTYTSFADQVTTHLSMEPVCGMAIPQYAYWDDCLTEQEIDLICGIYHVSTGQGGDSTQVAKVSWWPKPLAFDASGINVGWWTPQWEKWYQTRLQQLESGRGTLANHEKWKHNIKFERLGPPYTKGIEKSAARILETLRPAEVTRSDFKSTQVGEVEDLFKAQNWLNSQLCDRNVTASHAVTVVTFRFILLACSEDNEYKYRQRKSVGSRAGWDFEDEPAVARITSKNTLEAYTYNLRNVISEARGQVRGRRQDKARERRQRHHQMARQVLVGFSGAEVGTLCVAIPIERSKEEYEKQKGLEAIANPIIQKLYGAGGVPGGGVPGGEGFLGGAGGTPGGVRGRSQR